MSRRKSEVLAHGEPAGLPVEHSSSSFWHSQPSPLLLGHRSTRNLPPRADVVVIGSGITGTSVAHHLLTAQSGDGAKNQSLDVVMLEAREACWGATGRNGGHCQPLLFEHPNDPSIGRFELANFYDMQSTIKSLNIECEFVEQFGVRGIYSERHMREAEDAVAQLKTNAPDLGDRVHMLKGDSVEGKHRLNQLRLGTGLSGALGAVVTNIAARMWPYKFVSALLEHLLTSSELDGTFNLQTLTPALSISHTAVDGSPPYWTVKTSRGEIAAKKVVLATNAYTSHLLPDFSDLIVPCRGQMSALEPLPSLQGERRLQTSFGFLGDGLDDYLIQRPNESGGHLMFGGGRQHGPSIGTVDDSGFDGKTALYLRRRLVTALNLPEKKQSNHGGIIRGPTELKADYQWTGIMGFSRDDVPWVGPVPDRPDLYISAGYTGHGMPNTWLCGKSVATMILSGLEGEDEVEAAISSTQLPRAYVVSNERIHMARRRETVEETDWAEMNRTGFDRPHSGYA